MKALILLLYFYTGFSFAADDHADHEEAEVSSQVGLDKGVTEANEELGIKLSPEAELNFEITKRKITASSFELPKSALVNVLAEQNIYRFRDGFYKRVDFSLTKKTEKSIFGQSKEIKAGDEVVITGTGHLRIAEIAAFDGAPEGHSH